MNKEAIIFCIDAGSSMDQNFIDTESTRLKIALDCLKLTLQQKLFNNANHELGLVLFGENQAETDDGNCTVLQPVSKPELDFVRKIIQLSDIKLDNDKPGGDVFEAIDFIVDRLVNHCGTKKYNKRAFLFTNGRGPTKISKERLQKIAKTIVQNEIKLNIIPMDFMQTYDIEQNTLDDEVFAHPAQAQNSDLLIRLKQMCKQNLQIYPASLAIELYKKFRKRDTNPVALFKGQLKIAGDLTIDVCTYKAIRKQKLKSLSKFDLTAPFDPIIRKEKEIIVDINYVIEGEGGSESDVIPKEDVMNAYNYGDNLVPINEMVEKAARIEEEKNFTLLGFVESEKIPRHCFLGEVDMVVPQKENETSRKLFSAFIYTMLMQKKYAVARYVPRNSKRGVNPKLVVLIPCRSQERQMFYLTELPTIEGIRNYPFNSLKASNQKQQQLISRLVDKMMLVRTDEDGNEREDVKVENMFNPYRQYFYQTVFFRALNEDQKEAIPPLDQITMNYITPERRIYSDTDDELKRIKQEFRFKVNQIKKEGQEKKKTIVWRDIISHELGQEIEDEVIEAEMGMEVGKKFTLDNQNDEKFDPAEPILSFKKMANNNKKDLVGDALKEMSEYIKKRNNRLNTEEQNIHLMECAKEMREVCSRQHEEEFWDGWLERAVKGLDESLVHMIRVNGLGFLKRSNEGLLGQQVRGEMKPATQVFEEELD